MISFSHEQRDIDRIKWTNRLSGQFRYVPESFEIRLDLARWRSEFPGIDAVQVELPPNWVTDRPTWRLISPSDQTLCWLVIPCEDPTTCSVTVTFTGFDHGRPFVREPRTLSVEISGDSQFDPATDGISTPNSVAGWGVVPPDRQIFDQTFSRALFKSTLFNGLYRSIVFLGNGPGAYQGGICTGMARLALERSLSPERVEPNLARILLWHGRQLSDRALLAGAMWLFVPSPKRVFEAFRRELVTDGTVRRCFDIGVPKPWRVDLFTALKQEGHTVVPFAFEQVSDDRATVSVYDPNDPAASARGERNIVFDLRRNTYAYPGIASVDDHRTTIVAVEQRVYREGRTAILASIASLLTSCGAAVSQGIRQVLGRSRQWARGPQMPLS